MPKAAKTFIEGAHYLGDIGFPGEFPFTRGIYPTMYRGRLWTMRQYAGFGTAKEANERFHYLLKQGQRALSVAFDLPTQLGLDSDDFLARGEVGRVGVAINHVEDMEQLFAGIDLSAVSTSMTINATAPILLALYAAVAQRRGIGWEKLRGTVQNDILKEFIARGNYIYPPAASMRLVTDLIHFCDQSLPQWYPISISGYHIREAGATACQELAFTFANAIAYVRACVHTGLDVTKIARRLSFFFSVDNDFLEEIAKFRAARKIWAKILTEKFSVAKSESAALALRFHAQTAGSTLTAKQPRNNIARVTMQALAAVLGGAQSLHTNAWDEALALPSEASVRLALRTQQIIAEESGVVETIDPLGGSVAVEGMTAAMSDDVWTLLEEVEGLGGAVRAVETQFFQQAITQSAYEHQRAVEAGDAVVVGVNRYIDAKERGDYGLLQLDAKLEQQKLQKLKSFKKRRSAKRVQQHVDELQRAAADPQQNLLPVIIQALQADVTLGEISRALVQHFGRYTGDTVI